MLKIKKILGIFTLTTMLFVSNFSKTKAETLTLEDNNWNPQTKNKLEKLLQENSGKGKKVIFDFDNTVVSRDIGEATFAWLVKNNKFSGINLEPLSPEFNLEGKNISLKSVTDLTEYYEAINDATKHIKDDPSTYMSGYNWVVQIMYGKSVQEVVEATANSFMENKALSDREKNQETKITITENKTAYLVPFFHQENIDLIGKLLLNDYDVYVVSASNVWTVRHMVTKELPKLLQKKFGKELKIKPENVFGINTLIKDKRTGKLYKDYYLVRDKSEQGKLYAEMAPEELKNYEITSNLVLPVSGYEGKTAIINQYITKNSDKPFLVCGDSPGDFFMLAEAEHKLWFSRLENFGYQQNLLRLLKENQPESWLIQPVLAKKKAGLIRNLEHLADIFTDNQEKYQSYLKSVEILKPFNNF